jgi:transposase InsO family protein
VEHLNTAWAGDITYLWTNEGWLYLAVLLDLCSRTVVGWATSASLETSLCTEALEKALRQRKPPRGLVHHSDRGCQYASREYRRHLKAAGLVRSMSRKGDCWDNAVAESFFATLKAELPNATGFSTRAEAKAALFEYIEGFYNRRRLHSGLGYQSPAAFEEAGAAELLAA